MVRKYAPKKDAGTAGKTCNIRGCNNPAIHSLSLEAYESYLKDANLELKSPSEKKILACDAHWKVLKKKKRKDDEIKKVKFDTNTVGKMTGKEIGGKNLKGEP
jgi:hypothetical protein